jgi:hypothetical protein
MFVFLALDEFGSIHELFIKPMRAMVGKSSISSDYLYFAWFIPYTAAAAIIGAFFIKFLARLLTQELIIISLYCESILINLIHQFFQQNNREPQSLNKFCAGCQ